MKKLKKPDAATFFQEIAGGVELQKFMRARADLNGDLSMLGNIVFDADVFNGIINNVFGKTAARELEDEATKATNSECDSHKKLKPHEADDFDPAEQTKPKVAWDQRLSMLGGFGNGRKLLNKQ